MKNKLFLFVCLVVAGEVFYQLGYKYVPVAHNPLAVIWAVYVVEFSLFLLVSFLTDGKGEKKNKKMFLKTKTPYIFAIAILGFDFGYFFIYRIGGEASKVFNLSIPLQAIALAIIGVALYKEKLTKRKILGIVLSVIGVVLITM